MISGFSGVSRTKNFVDREVGRHQQPLPGRASAVGALNTVRKISVNLRRSVVRKIVKELRKFTTPVSLRVSFNMGVHIERV